MIFIFACSCGGAETLLRQKLKRYGYADWATIPLVQGKERSLRELDSAKDIPEVAMLISHISNSSSFAIILGTKNQKTAWADVSRNDFPSDVRAENIIKSLA